MDDCKGTLENLVWVLENVRRSSGGLFSRVRSHQFRNEFGGDYVVEAADHSLSPNYCRN